MKNGIFLLLMISTSAFGQITPEPNIDWQGHRGARGNYPENTLPGFFYALDQGMSTLELDVVITADSQVLLSHEPFMNHEICLDPDGNELSAKAGRRANIFEMTYDEVKKFDCGSLTHPDFEEQSNQESAKPLLKDVLELTQKHAEERNLPKPQYNIEIKSRPEWDGKYHPEVEKYVQLVMQVVQEVGVENRSSIQSLDVRVLQHIDSSDYKVKTALLVDENENARKKLESLGFTPDILSPHHSLVDEELMKLAKKEKMSVVVWTVNDEETAKNLIENYKVDGLITDFPVIRASLGHDTQQTIFPD